MRLLSFLPASESPSRNGYDLSVSKSTTSEDKCSGVTVKQTKFGVKFISRLKFRGADLHVGTFQTLEEAVVIREIAKFLLKKNNVGFLNLDNGGYVDSIPSGDDEERYFPIPPLTEPTEGDKKEAVRNRSKQIYTDFKKKQDERSLYLSLERTLMGDGDAQEHVGGHSEAEPSEFFNDQVLDSAVGLDTLVTPDTVGTSNQLVVDVPTNLTPSTHLTEAAETPLNGLQDSWRAVGSQSQVSRSGEASPISPPASFSNGTAPTIRREASFAQLPFPEAGPSDQAPNLAPIASAVVVLNNQLVDPTNPSAAMHLSGAPMNGLQDFSGTQAPQRELRSCGEAALISPPAPFSNTTASAVDREALLAQLVVSYQHEIVELKQENQELKRRLAERSFCSEENRPTKKR